MFTRLHRILLMTVVIIAIFFVVSSMSFTGRHAEGLFTTLQFGSEFNLFVYVRLCCQVMAPTVVAARWLAGASLFLRVLGDCFLMATIAEQ
jgi:hypothetical protein